MTRKPIFLLAFAFLLPLAISLWPRDGQALPADKPVIQNGYDLLAAVNSLRASNGLPAYSANAILMQIALAAPRPGIAPRRRVIRWAVFFRRTGRADSICRLRGRLPPGREMQPT